MIVAVEDKVFIQSNEHVPDVEQIEDKEQQIVALAEVIRQCLEQRVE